MKRLALVGLVVAAAAQLSCNPPIQTARPDGSGDGAAGSAEGGGPDFGLPISDAATVVPPPPPAKCAEDVHHAESVPVDLLLLVDTSESMNDLAGMRSKWSLVHDALVAFVRDPRSAGLGIGLQFFPVAQRCTSDADCPGQRGAPPVGSCAAPRVCVGAMPPAEGVAAPVCSLLQGAGETCAAGTTCAAVGRCSVSGGPCYAVGQPCAGGAPDLCQVPPRVCLFSESCAPADYQTLALPIAPLPAAATPLANRLNAVVPTGGTPTGPAVAGALGQARAHQAANPTHRVALVVATDGVPAGCTPMDGAGISAPAAAARAASPAIGTYVIGVFTTEEAPMATGFLQQLATAGGTGAPFVLDATADLGQRFQDALARIRGAVLPCEFMIPPPRGGAIDFSKVNVRSQGGSAPAEDLPYVGSADRCDPARGGWYYDVLPAAGTPGRVLVCPASCTRFRVDAAANVSLVFGCATRVIE
jgi:hypothetical protein